MKFFRGFESKSGSENFCQKEEIALRKLNWESIETNPMGQRVWRPTKETLGRLQPRKTIAT